MKQIVYDEPDNYCFGCSPRNEAGLKLSFAESAPGVVESRHVAAKHHCGAPDVVHGGIQAALLDEVMGVAIHSGLGGGDRRVVTVDFQLRYRRPALAGQPLTLRARYLRSEGRKHFVEGRIEDADGEVLTRAEACWYSLQSE